MPVPVATIPNLQRTDSTISINPNAGGNIGQALGQAGGALQSVSNDAMQWRQDRERGIFVAENAAMESALSVNFDEYEVQARAEGDESKWVPGWNERSNQIKTELLKNSRLSERSKVMLGAAFDQRNQRASETIKKKADVREISRSRAMLLGASEVDLENGDYSSFEKKIKDGIQVGLIDPEEGQKRLEQGQERVDYYEATALIETDPKLAEELLSDQTDTGRFREFKNLSPNSRNALLGSARKRGEANRAELYNKMSLDAIEGTLISVDEVVAMGRDGRLEAGQAAAYVRQHYSSRPGPFDYVEHANLRSDIQAYSKGDDQFGYEYSKLTARIMLQPSAVQTRLNSQLDAMLDPASKENGSAYKNGNSIINEWFSSGVFGNTKPDIAGELNQTEFIEAQKQRVQMMDELENYLTRNPDAKYEEVFTHLNGLLGSKRRKAGINIMLQTPANRFEKLDTEAKNAELERILSIK